MEKRMSLPVTFEMANENPLNDDTLMFSRIKVCHDGLNLNNSTFSTEAFESAKESIKNRPLLAYVKKVDGTDQKDFAGHEIELSISEDGIKVIYLERPIGVIPESNNYETEVDEDGKTWVYVDAIIWKDYANDAIDIFEENPNKPVSMEIVVDEYEEKNGTFDITKYRYTGVTVLGSEVSPAMTGANIQVQFSEDNSIIDMIKERTEDINFRLAEAYAEIKANKEEEKFEEEAQEVEENFEEEAEEMKEVFELTYNQRYDLLAKAVQKQTDSWAWVRDFTDNWVIYEVEAKVDDEWRYNNFKAMYTIDGEEVMIAEEKVEVFLTWATQEEIDTMEQERAQMSASYEELQEKLNKTEILLQDYQAKEREEQEEALFEQFDKVLKDSEEYVLLKEKKSDFSIEDLEKELRILHSEITMPKYTKKKSYNLTRFNYTEPKETEKNQENPYEGVNFRK